MSEISRFRLKKSMFLSGLWRDFCICFRPSSVASSVVDPADQYLDYFLVGLLEAYAQRCFVIWLKVEPIFDPLRGDPKISRPYTGLEPLSMMIDFMGADALWLSMLATAATDFGAEIQELSIEGTGDFNYAKHVAGGEGPDPGYRKIEYTLKIKSKNATREQLEDLAKLCETSSPARDTISRSVPISMKLQLD